MNWFVFTLISISALAIAELVQQKLLNDENDIDPNSSTVVTFGILTLLAIPAIFLFGEGANFFTVFDPKVFWYLVASSITATAAMFFYLRSFVVKNISFSTMLISFSVVVSTVLGILIFNESIEILKLIGIGLVLVAIAILNFNNAQLEKNNLYGLLAGVFFGITYTFDKMVILEIHPIVYLFWSYLFVVFLSYVQAPKAVNSAIKSLRIVDIRNVLISGAGYFVFNICTFFAYSVGGEVGRVDAINNTQVFLIILAEYFILKQRDGMVRKLVTACIAIAGVFILGNY